MTGDLISREALLLAFCESCGHGSGRCRVPCVDYDQIVQAPAVDAVPVVHGRWIDKGYITTAYGSIDTGCCSACGAVDVPIEPYDEYCPNCGAKMDKEADDALD